MKIHSIKFFDFLFFLLTFLFISDLNGTLSNVFHTKAFLSEIILLLTIILFIKSFQIPVKVPFLTRYYIFFYIFFLTFGTLLFFIKGKALGNPFERIRSLTPSIIVIYTFTKWFLYYISGNKFEKIINIIAIALFVNTLAIVYSHLSGSIFVFDNYTDKERSSGLIASVNQAGTVASIAQAFFLNIALNANTNKIKRLIYIVLYFVALYAAVVTFSKAAMLKSLLILSVFIYYYFIKIYKSHSFQIKNQRRRILLPFMFFSTIVVLFLGSRILSNFSEYQISRIVDFTSFLKGNINDEITTNRTSLAAHALDLIKRDYYLGRGLDTFHRMEGVGLGTHNQFLLILGETGFIGLLLYMAYYWFLLLKNFKIKLPELKFLGVSVIVVLIVTAASMHTMLFTKTMVIMFSLMNVLPEVSKLKVLQGKI